MNPLARHLLMKPPTVRYGWQLGTPYATNFREWPVGSALPPGWTSRNGTLTLSIAIDNAMPGGAFFAPIASATETFAGGYGMYSLDAAGSGVTDGDITAIIQSPSTTSANVASFAIGLRVTAASTGYEFRLHNEGTLGLDLLKSGVAHLSQPAFTWVANTLYAIRVRFQSTSIKCKVWAWPGIEPVAWDIDTTDATYASGYIGLEVPFIQAGANATNGRFCWFAFVPGTGAAPLPTVNGQSFF